ncbi:hypothetical protein [Occallatibacter riparius]|uniref:Uncharacterized protein n=1 Tax=Occallatibacter riparius TaxID=1002689 RepID=A0A9J7BRH4_9BACT|nr:hypothetical protein [Occallatibacter riparius]UWZ85272.1 hypothetical protein MOP44_04855 [Occallatibacter riparius]
MQQERAIAVSRILNAEVSMDIARALTGRVGGLSEDVTAELADYIALTNLEAIAVQRPQLGSLVDEWIDSGFDEHGTEHPYERFLPDGLMLDDRSVGVSTSLAIRSIERYQQVHPPRLHVRPRGGIDISFAAEGFEVKSGDQVPAQAAIRLFIEFFRSEWIFRLMRCAHCRTYQIIRSPRREYVRGWHCSACRKTAAAATSVKKSRELMQMRRLNAAARAICSGLPARAEKALWIAGRANHALALHERIKRNWVTRNLAQIEQMAHALGDGSNSTACRSKENRYATRKD